MKIIERFQAKYIINADNCWIWQASKMSNGYGVFTDTGRKTITAHRWSYTYFKGAIPDGLVIDHICRQPSCVNPAHLQAISQSENIKRSLFARNRGVRTHCSNGHEYTPKNTRRVPNQRGRVCLACVRLNKAKQG
jgi:hypothetical protein